MVDIAIEASHGETIYINYQLQKISFQTMLNFLGKGSVQTSCDGHWICRYTDGHAVEMNMLMIMSVNIFGQWTSDKARGERKG